VASPGQTVTTPVSLLDLAPTLLEIAGVSALPEAEGRSLTSALRGQALDERPIYSEAIYRAPHELKALRAGGFKLIYNEDDGSAQLFDLAADPVEQIDTSAEAGQIVGSMKDELFAWLAHTRQVAHDLPRAVPPTEFRDASW
jgi:arylsulfatase A-like enzyme